MQPCGAGRLVSRRRSDARDSGSWPGRTSLPMSAGWRTIGARVRWVRCASDTASGWIGTSGGWGWPSITRSPGMTSRAQQPSGRSSRNTPLPAGSGSGRRHGRGPAQRAGRPMIPFCDSSMSRILTVDLSPVWCPHRARTVKEPFESENLEPGGPSLLRPDPRDRPRGELGGSR
jgi:hypothetical protein